MKRFDKITLMLMLAIIMSVPVSYATGPGFNYNNQTWNHNGGDDDHSSGDDDDSGGDDDDYGCDDDWSDDDSNEIPLDGGLGFLAAAGAAYGVKRIRDNKGKNK